MYEPNPKLDALKRDRRSLRVLYVWDTVWLVVMIVFVIGDIKAQNLPPAIAFGIVGFLNLISILFVQYHLDILAHKIRIEERNQNIPK